MKGTAMKGTTMKRSTMTRTPRPAAPAATPEPLPSTAHRVARTALVVGALALVGVIAAVGASAAGSTDRVHAPAHHAGPGDGPGEAPPPPELGDTVGVLGLGGQPLVGLDGQPLQLTLAEITPPVPANANEAPPTSGPYTEDTQTLNVLEAHIATVQQVADDRQYSLVQRFDLLTVNGLLGAADGQSSTLSTHRAAVGGIDAGTAPCAAVTATVSAIDGQGTDPIVGLGASSFGRRLDDARVALGC
jgi:hypothetical protein